MVKKEYSQAKAELILFREELTTKMIKAQSLAGAGETVIMNILALAEVRID